MRMRMVSPEAFVSRPASSSAPTLGRPVVVLDQMRDAQPKRAHSHAHRLARDAKQARRLAVVAAGEFQRTGQKAPINLAVNGGIDVATTGYELGANEGVDVDRERGRPRKRPSADL